MTGPGSQLAAEPGQLGPADRELWSACLADLESGPHALPDKPEETASTALRALWQLAAGERMSARLAALRDLPPLDGGQRELLRELVARRLSGVPLAYLTERQSFMETEMVAGPGALIPRAETELLGRTAAAVLHQMTETGGPAVVIDVCTGGGNVAAALALADPDAIVYASDLSADAVALADRNMALLGLQDRVTLRVGDLLEPFAQDPPPGTVDLLTCNPPYISTGRVAAMPDEISAYEPRLAFDGGPLGVRILQRLIREAPQLLRPGGWLAFEVGAGQGSAVEQRLAKAGDYGTIESVVDAEGVIRVLLAQRRAGPPAGP